MTRAAFVQGDREELPEEQRDARRRAIRWQIFTVSYTLATIVLVAFVLGNSQAMKTAWIEDMLSLIPQIAFFISIVLVRKKPSQRHPYGWHRAAGVGHLVAGVALLTVGGTLAFESVMGLIKAEHPTIGTVQLFGVTIWLGWLMVGVMALVVVGPLIYGPAKSRLASPLHNKLLHADADMARADWHTNAASIVGVLGVGVGLWWLDGVAATFIALGIVWDGLRNTGTALSDLMDQRARTVDGSEPHPVRQQIIDHLSALTWVDEVAVRIRDQGQVLHVEAFVRPNAREVTLEQLGDAAAGIAELDWKIHDLVIVPTDPLPQYADRG
ncbi:MAG: cation transporter [Leucobacter sp.]